MLNKKYRLKKRKEFAYIYRVGKPTHTKYLTLVSTPTKLKDFKIGFSVSKKVGKAFARNLVKRRLTEIFKPLIDNLDSKFNYVIIAKAGCAELSFEELSKELHVLLCKCGHLNEDN